MSDDLKERLEALNKIADFGATVTKRKLARAKLSRTLFLKFKSGDLVTRSEMEEAVAKAVAKEREACAELAEKHCDWHPVNIPVANHIRARSEQKE